MCAYLSNGKRVYITNMRNREILRNVKYLLYASVRIDNDCLTAVLFSGKGIDAVRNIPYGWQMFAAIIRPENRYFLIRRFLDSLGFVHLYKTFLKLALLLSKSALWFDSGQI